ncbi:MAG: prepilin-type N-terminal cleavage/methylation domain-containing protein [Actinomycetota bacterium]|nr:prepilin-type N-terminal cleavage/methylation domain-containing protein [Actinomycetota bacterium]
MRDERGFTLPEMLVTMVIMIVVLFALYSIFDMSLRVFSFGNNKVEAVQSARAGLEKMEREIRQAYKYDSAASQNHVFFATASPTTAMTVSTTAYAFTQLTFGNDISAAGTAGAGKIECGSPCEYITYKLTDDSSGTVACTVAPCTLRRVNTANSADAGDPIVENVAANGLSFTLLKSSGNAPANESEVGMVLVSLDVVVDQGIGNAGTQKLTTVIDLRNR